MAAAGSGALAAVCALSWSVMVLFYDESLPIRYYRKKTFSSKSLDINNIVYHILQHLNISKNTENIKN